MEFLESLDDEKIDREPDRATPVRVAAEESGGRLARLVADLVYRAVQLQTVRMLQVVSADSADAVVAQKLRGIEHALEQPLHSVPTHQREQAALTHAWLLPAR